MRICGLLLIFSAPILTGLYIGGRIKRAISQLEEFYAIITEIKRKIRYLKLPLGEIYASLDSKVLGTFNHDLCNGGFEFALSKGQTSFCFSAELYKKLENFASELGRSDSEDQMRNCDIMLEQINSEREKLAVEAPEKIRIITSLSFMFGTMLLIILL